MVGQAGMVPWLNRVRGARTQVQVTAVKEGQKLDPVLLKPKQPIDPEAHLAQVERKKKVRAYLKANNLVVSKRVEFVTHNRWRTVSFLRHKKAPSRSMRGLEEQETRKLEQQLKPKRRLTRTKWKPIMKRVQNRLITKGAKIRFKTFIPFAGAKTLFRRRKYPRTTSSSRGGKVGRARPGLDFTTMTKYVADLMATDPPVRNLLESGEIPIRKLFDLETTGLRGPRRFGFRSRKFWQENRPHGFRRGRHHPGGLSFWGRKEGYVGESASRVKSKSRITRAS